jgi:YVTN family beta-propeller protein
MGGKECSLHLLPSKPQTPDDVKSETKGDEDLTHPRHFPPLRKLSSIGCAIGPNQIQCLEGRSSQGSRLRRGLAGPGLVERQTWGRLALRTGRDYRCWMTTRHFPGFDWRCGVVALVLVFSGAASLSSSKGQVRETSIKDGQAFVSVGGLVETPATPSNEGLNSSLLLPYVAKTLVLGNNSLETGNFLAANALGPTSLAIDPKTRQVFIANSKSNNLLIVDASTDRILASVPVGDCPSGVALDNRSDYVFITNSCSDNVTVINETTRALVSSIGVGSYPVGIAYDYQSDALYVTNEYSNNVSIINCTSLDTFKNIATGKGPVAAAYDTINDRIFVVDSGANNVTVIDGSNGTTVISLTVGEYPLGAVFDAAMNEVFVTDDGADTVTVIDATRNQPIARVSVGTEPAAIAYDPLDGEVFVANIVSDNVSVINQYTDRASRAIPVGSDPDAELFVPQEHRVLVANFRTNNISVINTTTDLSIASIGLGALPSGVVYDNGTGEAFVSDEYSNNLSVINQSSDQTDHEVPVGWDPSGMAYDASRGEVFVADHYSASVSVVNDSSDSMQYSIPVGNYPSGVALVGTIHEVFVTNSLSGNLTVINEETDHVSDSIAVGVQPTGLVFDPPRGEIFVANWFSDTVSVVNVTELHVTATIDVGVNPSAITYAPGAGEVFVANENSNNVSVINDSTNQIAEWIGVGSAPDGLAFDNKSNEVLVANSASDNVSVINLASDGVVSTISVGSIPVSLACDTSCNKIDLTDYGQGTVSILQTRVAYPVFFQERGLADNTSWSIALNGSAPQKSQSSVVELYASNGQYTYQVSQLVGYRSVISGGTLLVNGSITRIQISFVQTAPWEVVFVESGLPNNMSWAIQLNGSLMSSDSTDILFDEFAGTLAFIINPVEGFVSMPSSGSVNLTRAYLEINVTFFEFVAASYSITVIESGLPNGTHWSGNLDCAGSRTEQSTNGTELAFMATNGTCSFNPSAIPGWSLLPPAPPEIISVSGHPVSMLLNWTQVRYMVIFDEAGLGSGVPWAVTLNGITHSATMRQINVSLPNGTYEFSATASSPYRAQPSSGSLQIQGLSLVESINFSQQVAGSNLLNELSSGVDLWLTGAIAAIAIVGCYAIWARKRRGGPPPAP